MSIKITIGLNSETDCYGSDLTDQTGFAVPDSPDDTSFPYRCYSGDVGPFYSKGWSGLQFSPVSKQQLSGLK